MFQYYSLNSYKTHICKNTHFSACHQEKAVFFHLASSIYPNFLTL